MDETELQKRLERLRQMRIELWRMNYAEAKARNLMKRAAALTSLAVLPESKTIH